MVTKVHPSGGTAMTGVTPSQAAGDATAIDVLGSPSEEATNAALSDVKMAPTPTSKLVSDLKGREATDISEESDAGVFQRLRDNAEKRYGSGDAPMARMR